MQKICPFFSLRNEELSPFTYDSGEINPRIPPCKIRENARLQFSETRPSFNPKGLQTLLDQAIAKGQGHEISFYSSCMWGNKLQFWPKRLLSLKKRGQNCLLLTSTLPWLKVAMHPRASTICISRGGHSTNKIPKSLIR